jgi:hypothetical protein
MEILNDLKRKLKFTIDNKVNDKLIVHIFHKTLWTARIPHVSETFRDLIFPSDSIQPSNIKLHVYIT